MSMTRGNAHQYLKKVYLTTKNDSYREALSVALSALRPVSREQVENVWRGEWRWVGEDRWSDTYECSKCGKLSMNDYLFCPNCNSAMTDEAVDMVMERINEMEEMKK